MAGTYSQKARALASRRGHWMESWRESRYLIPTLVGICIPLNTDARAWQYENFMFQ